MKKSTTANRLKQIMEERNLRQVDILEKCAPYINEYKIRLGKNDLSQYVSGKVEPGQDKLTIMAKALNVSEAWLMGYDVEIESLNFDTTPDDCPYNRALDKLQSNEDLTEEEKKALATELPGVMNRFSDYLGELSENLSNSMLNHYISLLNAKGRSEALKRIKELTFIPEYKNKDYLLPNAAHEIPGATEEDKKHDDDIMNDENF